MRFILKVSILLSFSKGNMRRRPFREHHILEILEGYDQQKLPLDLYISLYFRSHKALGSKDRGFIADTIYAMTRWRGLLDFLCGTPLTWEKRLDIFSRDEFHTALLREDIPQHIRLSFPKVLFERIVASHGLEKACELCRISNTPAPTTVRINTLKASRDEMLARWKELYDVSSCAFAPNGIVFNRKINFYDMPEFKEGFFEVQDEGSQLLAELVQAGPGQSVMDYCAGSGGKTLAFAPRMQNTGQIFLHDLRKHALFDCRKRLRRAGIQNAQVVHAGDAKLKKLKKGMDWVLVDAPCTGTGTMRRNPDMKWKFDEEMLVRLLGQQRVIFEKALSFLKTEGHIVYATCSILNEENENQVSHFKKIYNLEIVGNIFESLPLYGGMDGFFGAVLKKK
jgi:16S rRNA (cytosine967-C5)-methyltransferase